MALDEAIRGKLGVCKRYGRDTEKYDFFVIQTGADNKTCA